MSGTALILAGHGSHISAETAGVIWRYVDRLRRLGVADEIGACFWKEPPALSQALHTVLAAEIVIVPVFTAQGYFAGQVIPSEMGLRPGLNVRAGKRIHLTPSIGEHAQLETIVEMRLREAVATHNLDPAQTAAAIIGHGTPRNRRSRDAARRQAERISGLNWLSEVRAVYLDDEPDIPSIYQSTRAPHILALPYFVAGGSHVTVDVPRALGISKGRDPQAVDGRTVYYCEPVGTDEAMLQLILDLARATGLPFAADGAADAWSGFPAAGKRTLMNALETENILRFGQLRVSETRVWHCANDGDSNRLSTPAELRRAVRETPFRPLPTRRDLPFGWHVDLDDPADAHAVVETVYPGLIADWAAGQRGELQTESLETIGARQQGMFQGIHLLPKQVIEQTIVQICGDCVRQPSWWRRGDAALPCRAACNKWLSAARKYGDRSA